MPVCVSVSSSSEVPPGSTGLERRHTPLQLLLNNHNLLWLCRRIVSFFKKNCHLKHLTVSTNVLCLLNDNNWSILWRQQLKRALNLIHWLIHSDHNYRFIEDRPLLIKVGGASLKKNYPETTPPSFHPPGKNERPLPARALKRCLHAEINTISLINRCDMTPPLAPPHTHRQTHTHKLARQAEFPVWLMSLIITSGSFNQCLLHPQH